MKTDFSSPYFLLSLALRSVDLVMGLAEGLASELELSYKCPSSGPPGCSKNTVGLAKGSLITLGSRVTETDGALPNFNSHVCPLWR